MEHAKLLKCRNFLAAIYLISLLISGSNPALAINAARDYQLEFSLPRQEQASVFLWLISIATAHDGSIWTSDNSSGYVQHFKADGSFIANFKAKLADIAVANDGSVWGIVVTGDPETFAIIVNHYAADGKFINSFSIPQKIDGRSSLTDLSIAADGSLWVMTDRDVQHFTTQGSLLTQFSIKLASEAKLLGFSLSPDGSLWLSATDALLHYQANGTLLTTLPQPEIGQPASDIAEAKDGSLWLSVGKSFYHLQADGSLISKTAINFSAAPFDYAQSLKRLAIAANGDVWGVVNNFLARLPVQENTIQLRSSGTLQPVAPVANVDGSIWFADINNQRLLQIQADGTMIKEVQGIAECEEHQYKRFSYMQNPMNYRRKLALAPDASFWVMDSYVTSIDRPRDRRNIIETCLQHIDSSGKVIKALKSSVTVTEMWTDDSSFTIASDGSIWLENPKNNELQHLSSTGEVLGRIAGNPLNSSQKEYGFTDIGGLALAADGSLWISHYFNGRIEHLQPNGQVIKRFNLPDNSGSYIVSKDIAVDAEGRIWVADNLNKHLQHLTLDGQFIAEINIPDSALAPNSTFDIAVSPNGTVWLADTKKTSNYFFGTPRLLKFSQADSRLSPVADYDAANQWLTIRDVEAEGQHYQAALRGYEVVSLLGGELRFVFELVSLNPASSTYSQAAQYSVATGQLILPEVLLDGKAYTAILQRITTDWGGTVYQLQSATLK